MRATALFLLRAGLVLTSVALVACAQAPAGPKRSGLFSPYRVELPPGQFLDREMVARV